MFSFSLRKESMIIDFIESSKEFQSLINAVAIKVFETI